MVNGQTSGRSAQATGLECVAGRARVAVPVVDVVQVVEYEVASPLPLACPFVGGLGTLGGDIVISIEVDSISRDITPRRMATGVVLSAPAKGLPGWVLEVREVRSFVEVGIDRVPVGRGAESMPSFITLRRTLDQRTIGWIDVPRLLRQLGREMLGVEA